MLTLLQVRILFIVLAIEVEPSRELMSLGSIYALQVGCKVVAREARDPVFACSRSSRISTGGSKLYRRWQALEVVASSRESTPWGC